MEELDYLEKEKLKSLKTECEEIVKVMTVYKKKLSDNLPK